MTALDILLQYRVALLGGLFVTLHLCCVVWSTGILLGGALGFAGARWPKAVGLPLSIVSVILSSIPVLVLLIWMYFPLQTLIGIQVSSFWTAAMALALMNTVAVMELVRHAVSKFPREYLLTPRIYGVGPIRAFLKITLPLVLREILPSVLAAQVVALQGTLFASIISVEEIFRVAQRINSNIYAPVEIYSTLAIAFILVCVPLNVFALWLGRHLKRDLSEV